MKTQLTKRSLIALALIAMLASSAGATVLHDQSSVHPGWYDGSVGGFLNLVAGSFPFGMTVYGVSDITVGGTGWVIESITTYVQALGGYDTYNTAYINVFEKTGPLPTDIPDSGTPVSVTIVETGANEFTVTASGLSIELEPGTYWIGLTPQEGSFNTSVQLPALNLMGDGSAGYDIDGMPAPMWVTWRPGYDSAILIEGDDTVVATENVSMGSVKALFR